MPARSRVTASEVGWHVGDQPPAECTHEPCEREGDS